MLNASQLEGEFGWWANRSSERVDWVRFHDTHDKGLKKAQQSVNDKIKRKR
jgi:hypothetical protein